MELSEKEKTFSQFVSAFLKAKLNFEHYQEKNDPHSWYNSEITKSEIRG